MRADMAKVICERPRCHGDGGRSIPPKGTNKRLSKEMSSTDAELCRKRESNARHRVYGWNAKEFGELLGPLKGFILSCIGRKWDDVYSEVCQRIDKGSVTQKHILTHLFQYIATNVYIKDGKIYDGDYSNYRARQGLEIYQLTYVHPETGIICRTPVKPKYRRRNKSNDNWHAINDTQAYYRKDGIWYLMTFKPLPEGKSASGWDLMYNEGWSWNTWIYKSEYLKNWQREVSDRDKVVHHYINYYGLPVYCVGKKQLNKSEIRKLKKEI